MSSALVWAYKDPALPKGVLTASTSTTSVFAVALLLIMFETRPFLLVMAIGYSSVIKLGSGLTWSRSTSPA
jgi:hypothetical protein